MKGSYCQTVTTCFDVVATVKRESVHDNDNNNYDNHNRNSTSLFAYNKLDVVMQLQPKVIDVDYDLIIGYRDLKQHPELLRDLLEKPTVTGKPQWAPDEVTMRRHLLAAYRESIHVSELLTGGSDEGDDISEQFEHDAPWEGPQQQEENSLEYMINLMDIQGDTEFVNKVKDLFRKYPTVLSMTVDKTPANVTPFTVDVDEAKWKNPKNSGPPRTQSAVKDEEITRQVQKLLELGVIRPSQAKYYSHPHLTPKPDGSWRFCIDYRALNNCSKSLGWPIPNIDQLLRRIGAKKANCFATFDLTSGYHQTAVDESTSEFTAFICSSGLYEWVRTPFGLKGAPSYFMQKMATEVLNGLLYNTAECYIDDVITWGKTPEELLANIELLLKRFRDKNIKLHPKKS
jgi:hypothetical protein